MSEFASIIWKLQTDIDSLTQRVAALECPPHNEANAEDIREQGAAIRDLTMVLERVVNQVFPEHQKDED